MCVHNSLHVGSYLITYCGIICWIELKFQLHWVQVSNMKNINMPPKAELPLGNFKPETYNQFKKSAYFYTKICHMLGNKYQKAGTFSIF